MATLAVAILASVVNITGFTIETNIKIEARRQAIEAKRQEQEQKTAMIRDANQLLAGLYNDELPSLTATDADIDSAIYAIEKISDQDIKNDLLQKIQDIKTFRAFDALYRQLFVNDYLAVEHSNLEELFASYNKLPSAWQKPYSDGIKELKSQKETLDQLKSELAKLFTNESMQVARGNVTREEYKTATDSLKRIKNPEIISQLNQDLNKVIWRIEARERAEAEARRRAEIEAAWVKISTPYVSQNHTAVYNGCEVASLLMGLQYRGILRGKSLPDFANDVPKSDDPHTGFIRSIFDYLPNDVAHWIAPDALSNFGRRYYGGVTNITGIGIDGLKSELSRGNPVIVYVTTENLTDPKWVGEEVPKNLHVVLLIGYNPKSGQIMVNDPWTRNATGAVIYSEARFASIFNQIGRKAVAIR